MHGLACASDRTPDSSTHCSQSQAIASTGAEPPPFDELPGLLKRHDGDGDGKLTFDEFRALIDALAGQNAEDVTDPQPMAATSNGGEPARDESVSTAAAVSEPATLPTPPPATPTGPRTTPMQPNAAPATPAAPSSPDAPAVAAQSAALVERTSPITRSPKAHEPQIGDPTVPSVATVPAVPTPVTAVPSAPAVVAAETAGPSYASNYNDGAAGASNVSAVASADEPPLPEGWEAVTDELGRVYFWNYESDEVCGLCTPTRALAHN